MDHLKAIWYQAQYNQDDFKINFDYRVLSENLENYARAKQDYLAIKANFNYASPRGNDKFLGSIFFPQATLGLKIAAHQGTRQDRFTKDLISNKDFEDALREIMRPKIEKILRGKINDAQELRYLFDLPPHRPNIY